jgi:hypothetical protein
MEKISHEVTEQV